MDLLFRFSCFWGIKVDFSMQIVFAVCNWHISLCETDFMSHLELIWAFSSVCAALCDHNPSKHWAAPLVLENWQNFGLRRVKWGPVCSHGWVSVSFNGLFEILPTRTRSGSENGNTVNVSYAAVWHPLLQPSWMIDGVGGSTLEPIFVSSHDTFVHSSGLPVSGWTQEGKKHHSALLSLPPVGTVLPRFLAHFELIHLNCAYRRRDRASSSDVSWWR